MSKQWMLRQQTEEQKHPDSAEGNSKIFFFELTGPFTSEEIKQKIAERKLSSQDEVCLENEYWFSITETEEVRKYLGSAAYTPQKEEKKLEDTLENIVYSRKSEPFKRKISDTILLVAGYGLIVVGLSWFLFILFWNWV